MQGFLWKLIHKLAKFGEIAFLLALWNFFSLIRQVFQILHIK